MSGPQPRRPDELPHHWVARDLRYGMLAGAFRAGMVLPSEAAMITVYGVSRMTIRAALRDLSEEGLITARQGAGTYVRNNLQPGVTVTRTVRSLYYQDGTVASHTDDVQVT
jgi:GntR family transcriptional regulator